MLTQNHPTHSENASLWTALWHYTSNVLPTQLFEWLDGDILMKEKRTQQDVRML